MTEEDLTGRLSCLALIIAGLCAIWFGVFAVRSYTTQAECLRVGYPDSRVTLALTSYCIRRVNQTDEVVPLAQVKK